jgi:short-subunit dehydrogenase
VTIVITGAGSGIGRELARRYILTGHTLHLLSKSQEKLEELKLLAHKHNSKCFIYPINVSDFEKLQTISREICENESRIDMVIANAGISAEHSAMVQEFEVFRQIMDVNFTSVHALFEHFIHKMLEQKSGKLVIISSLASFVAMPTTLAYSASKRALNSYADSLRLLFTPKGISVINIQPGFIKTAMTDKNRFKMPFLMELTDGVDEIQMAIDKGLANHAFPYIFSSFVKFLALLPQAFRDLLILRLAKSAYGK